MDDLGIRGTCDLVGRDPEGFVGWIGHVLGEDGNRLGLGGVAARRGRDREAAAIRMRMVASRLSEPENFLAIA
jgi:hypothetical protein